MSVAQALAIAAAAWVTAIAADPPIARIFYRTHAEAVRLAARIEVAANSRLEQMQGGFHATPDGVRIERASALR